jgi:hypothetical protein
MRTLIALSQMDSTMHNEFKEPGEARLRRVIYLTPTAPNVSQSWIDGIASDISKANDALGITGLMLHKEGMLLHVVEGEYAAMEQLLGRMKGDRRQQSIHIASDALVESRGFEAWSLGTTARHSTMAPKGLVFEISRVRIQELTEAIDSNLVKSFLTTFVEHDTDTETTVEYC